MHYLQPNKAGLLWEICWSYLIDLIPESLKSTLAMFAEEIPCYLCICKGKVVRFA